MLINFYLLNIAGILNAILKANAISFGSEQVELNLVRAKHMYYFNTFRY